MIQQQHQQPSLINKIFASTNTSTSSPSTFTQLSNSSLDFSSESVASTAPAAAMSSADLATLTRVVVEPQHVGVLNQVDFNNQTMSSTGSNPLGGVNHRAKRETHAKKPKCITSATNGASNSENEDNSNDNANFNSGDSDDESESDSEQAGDSKKVITQMSSANMLTTGQYLGPGMAVYTTNNSNNINQAGQFFSNSSSFYDTNQSIPNSNSLMLNQHQQYPWMKVDSMSTVGSTPLKLNTAPNGGGGAGGAGTMFYTNGSTNSSSNSSSGVSTSSPISSTSSSSTNSSSNLIMGQQLEANTMTTSTPHHMPVMHANSKTSIKLLFLEIYISPNEINPTFEEEKLYR
jgi:hypothetical protein